MELWLWMICLVILYKILDWLVRIPSIRGRQDRYILVTGCDTGFGHEISKRLDASGCHVFAGCLTEKGATGLKAECSSRLVPLLLDISDPESVRKARRDVEAKLPPGKGLWGLINNAGIFCTWGPVEWRSTVKDYKKTLDVNLYGVIDVTVTFLPLVKREKGRIVNTTSVAGRSGVAFIAPYCVSKFGVEGFSETLRKELRQFGCSVHIIEPGAFKTNVAVPAKLPATAWDQASVEVKRDYGEDYPVKGFEAYMDMCKSGASERISYVMDAYEQALFGTFPRARYLVGWDACIIWQLIQWLPEGLGDRLHDFMLLGRIPIPVSLQDKKKAQ